MTTQILVVEDEVEIAQSISWELEAEGYDVQVVHDGFEGLSIAREANFDLILLDWMLPGISGWEICRRLRQTGDQVPIVFLTAQQEVKDRVSGLDAGADDYMLKPFNVEELLARVRSNLRRSQISNSGVFKFADISLNTSARKAYRGDRLMELTNKEFELLTYFLTNPKQVLSRGQILSEIWGYDATDDSRIIEAHIRNLRQKLEKEKEVRLIQTVRGIGYILREKD